LTGNDNRILVCDYYILFVRKSVRTVAEICFETKRLDIIVNLVYHCYGDTMKNSKKIISLYFRSMKRFEELERVPQNFGTEHLLYSSEIHTIQAIGDHPNINLTSLADSLGISKSGASKFIGKLLQKGLITKNKQINNDKEVVFNLTKTGYIAYQKHEEFSKECFKPVYELLSGFDETQTAFLETFLKDLNTTIDQIKILQ